MTPYQPTAKAWRRYVGEAPLGDGLHHKPSRGPPLRISSVTNRQVASIGGSPTARGGQPQLPRRHGPNRIGGGWSQIARIDADRHSRPGWWQYGRSGDHYRWHQGSLATSCEGVGTRPIGGRSLRLPWLRSAAGPGCWSSPIPPSRHSSIRDGVDTYLIEDGRIVAQTIHYTVTSSELNMTHLGDEPDATKG